MTKLVWDKVEDRRFELGVERGVLFPLGGGASPWNGLVSVSENQSREIKSYYIDGVKFLDHPVPGSYSGKITAYTYPEILEEILGTRQFAPGVNLHDQRTGMFHLSYRTRVGDALDEDAGYKLHLLYNLTANPGDVTFTTVGKTTEPTVFEWTISGVQRPTPDIRPTNHLSFDSRFVDPALLTSIEDQIYGTDIAEPVFPDLADLLTTIAGEEVPL